MSSDWLWMTSADGVDHLVTEPAMAMGRITRTGLYVAACGTLTAAAALVTPPMRRCSLCTLWGPC
jgi:hypothetical protein